MKKSKSVFMVSVFTVLSMVYISIFLLLSVAYAQSQIKPMEPIIQQISPQQKIIRQLKPIPLPDLIPLKAVCKRKLDGQYQLTIFIRNQGSADASSSYTKYEASGYMNTVNTPSVPQGGDISLTAPYLPLGCFKPDCAIKITVDAFNTVNESNETNNILDAACKGDPQPDLVVNFSGPSAVKPGDNIAPLIKFELKNIGPGTAYGKVGDTCYQINYGAYWKTIGGGFLTYSNVAPYSTACPFSPCLACPNLLPGGNWTYTPTEAFSIPINAEPGQNQICGSAGVDNELRNDNNNSCFKYTISCAPLTFTTPSQLTAGTEKQQYNYTLKTSGGYPPVKFSLISGNLPAGLNLSTSGAISGIPVKAGIYTFKVLAQDSCPTGAQTKEQGFTLQILKK